MDDEEVTTAGSRIRFRKLRIAWSVLCGTLCVLLIVLWVRSYKTADRLHGRFWGRQSFVLASKEGGVAAIVFRSHGAPGWWRWETISYPVEDELSFPAGPTCQYVNTLGFGWLRRPLYMVMRSTQTLPDGSTVTFFGAATATLNGAGPIVPHWFLMLLTAGCGVAQYIKKNFSLRSLLIAMSLVAVALGALVYATK
jgi:hypothetical protein